MYAITVLVVKRPESTIEDFRSWWIDKHAPYSVELLGAVDHILLPIDHQLKRRSTDWSAPLSYDGVAIFLFDDEEAATKAMTYPRTAKHTEGVDEFLENVITVGGPANLALDKFVAQRQVS